MKFKKISKAILNLCFLFLFYIYFVRKSSNKSLTLEKIIIQTQMKGPLSAYNEELIREVAENFLIPPSSKEYNLMLNKKGNEARIYNSNYRDHPNWQYLYEETKVLFPKDRKHKGFYIEVGAFDGEFYSNSLFLEMDYGWNGLLIEPDKSLFQSLLKKNRKAWSSNCCLSTNPYPHETVLKIIDSNNGKTLSQYSKIYNSISESRTNDERNDYGVPLYETVQCIPLHTLLLALNRTHVDLIYLDVEDVEEGVLNNFAYDKINVDVWIIEHRNPQYKFEEDAPDQNFIKWFESKGHVLYKKGSHVLDYIFIMKSSYYYEQNHRRLHI